LFFSHSCCLSKYYQSFQYQGAGKPEYGQFLENVYESDDTFFALGLLSSVAAGQAAAETVSGEIKDT
jgi:hypothetical protein